MKKIYTNLKRFDVKREFGGLNTDSEIKNWPAEILKGIDESLKYSDAEFVFFFPETHLIGAVMQDLKKIRIGSQGVHFQDVQKGGNFGAFTGMLPAAACAGMGVNDVLIGHSEHRKALEEIIKLSGGDTSCVSQILNSEMKCAAQRGMKILYCIGEKQEEMNDYERVLREQIEKGLDGIDRELVSIAYEPIWAIGPGKTPPGREYIEKIAEFVKKCSGGLPLVYGGGLKAENADMLASIDSVDGGLIALTRFSGDIGFYPEEYIEIVDIYMKGGVSR